MRKLVLILGIACLLAWTLPQICSAEIDPETAVGVWLFDEGAGKTTKDACGSWEPRASAHVPDEKNGSTSQRLTTVTRKTSNSLCT